MKGDIDKSLLFLFLSFVCIWLVVDVAVGKNYLGNFLSTVFPFMSGGDSLAEETLAAQGNISSSGLVDLNDDNRTTAAKTAAASVDSSSTGGYSSNRTTAAKTAAASANSSSKTYTTTDGKQISEYVYQVKKNHAAWKIGSLTQSALGR